MRAVLIVIIGSCFSFFCNAADYFVSPNAVTNSSGEIHAPWTLAEAFSHPQVVKPGDIIWLRGGVYLGEFLSRLTGERGQPITVRQYPGERATIDGSIEIQGAWTSYWGFEVRNSLPLRLNSQWTRPPGINLFGVGVKLINLIIHDAGQGIGWWDEAEDSEVYGCLIYNNGNSRFDHGIYAQNRVRTKYITDNFIFNNYGYGLHIFGSETASLKGFKIRGNTIFNNGSLSATGDAHNLTVSGAVGVERISFLNNLTYSKFKEGSVTFGSDSEVDNKDIEIRNNQFVDYVLFQYWKLGIVAGNTFVSGGKIIDLRTNLPIAKSEFNWNNNNYFSNEFDGLPFGLGSREKSTRVDHLTWRSSTGLDQASNYQAGRPSGTQVFLRHNRYESGRIHVTIYNWDLKDKIAVDLKPFLPIGASFEVRNVQDVLSAPIFSGVFTGAPVELPMNGLTVATPVGLATPPPTGPEFNAFLVLPAAIPGN